MSLLRESENEKKRSFFYFWIAREESGEGMNGSEVTDRDTTNADEGYSIILFQVEANSEIHLNA